MNAVVHFQRFAVRRSNGESAGPAMQVPARPATAVTTVAEINILYADSDPRMHELVCPRLHSYGMKVRSAFTAREMWSASRQSPVDLIILDFMLPDADGLDLCQRIRRSSDVPIIMVASPHEASERVPGLESGADDWLVKPVDVRELVARIRTILRRARGAATPLLRKQSAARFASHTLKLSTRELVPDEGTPVPLSNSLYRLLNAFVTSPGVVLSRDDLMYATHGRPSSGYDRTIDNHVVKLRQLLGDDGDRPELIRTVRGAGYLFVAEVQWL